MGFFSAISDAAKIANEEAHGRRLLTEFQDSIQKMGNMPRDRSDEIITRFVHKRSGIVPAMRNWTIDGVLKMAATIKTEARRVTDLNVIEGYALWMTSAWLESSARQADNAKAVFEQLDQLARAHEAIKLDRAD